MKLFQQYIYPRLILDLITFYPFLIIFGAIAARIEVFTIPFLIGTIVNYLMLVFAFVYNDIEDAEGDARSIYKAVPFHLHMQMNFGTYEMEKGFRRFQNPFSNNMITKETGILTLFIIFLVSAVTSFLVGGFLGVFIALSNLAVGVLYSGGIARFKSQFPIDILSHSYLLAGVQVLYFFAYRDAVIDILSWGLLLSAMLFSIGGDLWNEYRDFEDDQEDGLKNTASILGKKNTYIANKVLSFIGLGLTMTFIVLIFLEHLS